MDSGGTDGDRDNGDSEVRDQYSWESKKCVTVQEFQVESGPGGGLPIGLTIILTITGRWWGVRR